MSPSHAPHARGETRAGVRAPSANLSPTLLRVAVVSGGQVLDEVRVADAEITVGASERCTLVVPPGTWPEAHRLFARVRGRYELRPLAGMQGRIALGDEVVDVATRGPLPIPLTAAARGRVTVGGVTVLFQRVAAEPDAPRPVLPRSLRLGVRDAIDWRTTVLGALSFLLHFGVLATIYSDWLDPVVDEEARVASIVEALQDLPLAPPVEPTASAPEVTATATAPARSETATSSGRAGGDAGRGAGARGGGAGRREADARAERLSAELDALDVRMLAVLGGGGRATDRVIGEGGVSTQLLEDLAASGRGVRRDAGDGLSTGGGGRVRPGEVVRGGLPGELGPRGPVGAGSASAAAPPAPPKPRAEVAPPTLTGTVPGAEGVIARHRGGLLACYRRGLEESPRMRGTVRVTLRIGPNGEVLSATPSAGGGLSPNVVGCVVGKLGAAQFAQPVGGGAVLVVPITFIPGE